MRYVAPALVLALAACGSPATENASSSAASASTAASITFASDWSVTASAPLVAGASARIVYDPNRLTTCRDSQGGRPLWGRTGYASVNGLTPVTFAVAGVQQPSEPPSIALPFAGDLAIWFENQDAYGCNAYDSAYGANYHFTIAPPANAPGWVGNATSIVTRDECGYSPCDSDAVSLDRGFTFDTWARQRATFALVRFEAWKSGVTDWSNPDLWKDLDVELHARIGGFGDFQTSYVNFDRNVGNNARYALDVKTIDPLSGQNGGALTDKSRCPTFPTTKTPDGYLQADYQFYFTVNGVAVQPAGGGVFHGTFQNYAGLYAICDG